MLSSVGGKAATVAKICVVQFTCMLMILALKRMKTLCFMCVNTWDCSLFNDTVNYVDEEQV